MLLSSMFISSYTTIYYFVEKFIFSNGYILENAISECLDKFFFCWERGYQLSTYATGGEMGYHPKCVQLRKGGRAVTPHVCIRTYAISFHIFGSILILKCFVLFPEI